MQPSERRVLPKSVVGVRPRERRLSPVSGIPVWAGGDPESVVYFVSVKRPVLTETDGQQRARTLDVAKLGSHLRVPSQPDVLSRHVNVGLLLNVDAFEAVERRTRDDQLGTRERLLSKEIDEGLHDEVLAVFDLFA